ncbi:CYP4B1 [Acanthosepion pharaonis]|uniref:CYP4B1 n=1 Tax=Acanthosepion pharaonis TaxID=158019 RepID=A0A812AYC4_ACAPH|nr:CYP4B1 [Sepia pharaonis]
MRLFLPLFSLSSTHTHRETIFFTTIPSFLSSFLSPLSLSLSLSLSLLFDEVCEKSVKKGQRLTYSCYACLMISFVTIFFLFLTHSFFCRLKKFVECKSAALQFPCLPKHWFWGNLEELKNPDGFLSYTRKMMEKRCQTFCCWVSFLYPGISIAHPDAVKTLIRSAEPKPMVAPGYVFVHPWLGDGLLLSTGKKWERNRKLLTPAFHFDILKSYIPIYNSAADKLINKLSVATEKCPVIDVIRPFSFATLDIMLRCALSYTEDIQAEEEHHPYVTAVTTIGDLLAKRVVNVFHYSDWIYRLSSDGRKFYRMCKEIHKFSDINAALPVVNVYVEGKRCSALVDTGCSRSIVSADRCVTWNSQQIEIRTIDGVSRACCGVGTVSVLTDGGSHAKVDVLVARQRPLGYDLLLGIDAIRASLLFETFPFLLFFLLSFFFLCLPPSLFILLNLSFSTHSLPIPSCLPLPFSSFFFLSFSISFFPFFSSTIFPYILSFFFPFSSTLSFFTLDPPLSLFSLSLFSLPLFFLFFCLFFLLFYSSLSSSFPLPSSFSSPTHVLFFSHYFFFFLRFSSLPTLSDVYHDYISIICHKVMSKANPDMMKGKKKLDFLDILVTARDSDGVGLSNLEIRNEVDTFMFEGHDTTACSLSWMMYAMAIYPNEQQNIYNEIQNVLQGRTEVTWEDLPELRYLTACLKESIRLFTTVPMISRSLTRPFVIDGKLLPAGMTVSINIYAMHHNPDVWQEPEEFLPSRFLSDDPNPKNPYMYIPFSAGPRNCIGQNFAMHEMKVMVAKIIQAFEITADPTYHPEPIAEMVLRSRTGIRMQFPKATDLVIFMSNSSLQIYQFKGHITHLHRLK